MARDRELPGALGKLHPKYNTPSTSVLAVGITMTAISFFLPMSGAVAISTFASLFCYALANASALRLRKDAVLYPRFLAAAGLATCLALLFLVPLKTIWAGLIALLFGALVLAAGKAIIRRRTDPN
jgi:APA family basic amino acid/polyamine antiporter